MKTRVACLSKTEHSLAHEEKGVGKLCHSAIWRDLPKPSPWQGLRTPGRFVRRQVLSPGPCFRRSEMPVPPQSATLGVFLHSSLGCSNRRSYLLYKPCLPSREHWCTNLRFWPGAPVKGLAKKVMHVRAFLLLRSGPEWGGRRREVGWFVFKQLFILLPLNFWSEEVFLPPPSSFRVFLCIALLFGFPLFSDSRKKFYWLLDQGTSQILLSGCLGSLGDLSFLKILLFAPHALNTKM